MTLQKKTQLPGLYCLRIWLKKRRRLAVGRLGVLSLAAGWYVYTGSAKGGLVQRVQRHLRQDKLKYWHIDYLLAVADSIEAFVLPEAEISECELHSRFSSGVGVAGFGCSDCRCPSHLAYFRTRPAIRLMAWRAFVRQCGAECA